MKKGIIALAVVAAASSFFFLKSPPQKIVFAKTYPHSFAVIMYRGETSGPGVLFIAKIIPPLSSSELHIDWHLPEGSELVEGKKNEIVAAQANTPIIREIRVIIPSEESSPFVEAFVMTPGGKFGATATYVSEGELEPMNTFDAGIKKERVVQ